MPEAAPNGNAGTGSGGTGSTTPAATTTPASTGTGTTTPTTPSTTPVESSAVGSLERASARLESESAPSTDKPLVDGKPAGAEAQSTEPGAVGKAVATPPNTEAVFHLPKDKVEYDRILSNARNNAVKAAMEPGGPLAWANGLDGEAVREAAELFRQINADPRKWAQEVLAEAGGGGGNGEEEEAIVDPEADYSSPDGKAQFYSKEAMAKLLSNQEKRLTAMMKPALSIAEKQADAERFGRIRNEAAQTAQEVMAVLQKDPRFEPNKKLVAAKLAAIPKEVRQKVGAVAALYMAYHAVLAETVIPGLESATEKRLKDENDRQIAASRGSVVPGGPNAGAGRKPVKDGDVNALASRIGEIASSMGG